MFNELIEAKEYSRKLRGELSLNGIVSIQMIHASDQLEAEELLHQKYNKNIIESSKKNINKS